MSSDDGDDDTDETDDDDEEGDSAHELGDYLGDDLDDKSAHDLTDDPDEPFIPLGSEELPAEPVADENFNAHTAIARSLYPNIPRVLRKEARAFFDGAMYAYTEGDLAGARLSFLAVAGIGDPDTAPAAMVFLGVIAFRRRSA